MRFGGKVLTRTAMGGRTGQRGDSVARQVDNGIWLRLGGGLLKYEGPPGNPRGRMLPVH